jgi:mono/diheme cytochrome c family protein
MTAIRQLPGRVASRLTRMKTASSGREGMTMAWMKKEALPLAALAAAVFLVLAPGTAFAWPWSWDMFDQPSHKAQEGKAPFVPAGRVPTDGTIAPYRFKTREEAAANLTNPIPPTEQSIARGKVMYDIYCALCHGGTGHGDGKLGKKYMTPADLTSEHSQRLRDGSLYYTISYGAATKDEQMPGYADALSPEDRWHVVNYMKGVIAWW